MPKVYVPFLRWVCVNCLEDSMADCQIRTKMGVDFARLCLDLAGSLSVDFDWD